LAVCRVLSARQGAHRSARRNVGADHPLVRRAPQRPASARAVVLGEGLSGDPETERSVIRCGRGAYELEFYSCVCGRAVPQVWYKLRSYFGSSLATSTVNDLLVISIGVGTVVDSAAHLPPKSMTRTTKAAMEGNPANAKRRTDPP
jgi:hypothetical protein